MLLWLLFASVKHPWDLPRFINCQYYITRRHPSPHLQAIRKQDTEMLRQDLIEPAVSAHRRSSQEKWQMRFLLTSHIWMRQVTKICIRCRVLTSAWTPWQEPNSSQPLTHEQEDGPCYAEKTTFVTREGTFKFKVMLFGLAGALATFQRLMDLVMAELNL